MKYIFLLIASIVFSACNHSKTVKEFHTDEFWAQLIKDSTYVEELIAPKEPSEPNFYFAPNTEYYLLWQYDAKHARDYKVYLKEMSTGELYTYTMLDPFNIHVSGNSTNASVLKYKLWQTGGVRFLFKRPQVFTLPPFIN